MEMAKNKKLNLLNHLWVVVLISAAFHSLILFYPLIKPIQLISSIQSTDQVIQAFLQSTVKQNEKPVKKIVKRPKKKKLPIKKVEAKKQKEAEKPIKEQEVIAESSAASNQQIQSVSKKFESVISQFVQPQYPRIAIARGLTGVVVLRLKIKGNGSLEEVAILKSSGHSSLDDSALAAAKLWKFKSFSEQESTIFTTDKTVVYQINQ